MALYQRISGEAGKGVDLLSCVPFQFLQRFYRHAQAS